MLIKYPQKKQPVIDRTTCGCCAEPLKPGKYYPAKFAVIMFPDGKKLSQGNVCEECYERSLRNPAAVHRGLSGTKADRLEMRRRRAVDRHSLERRTSSGG